MKEIAVIGAGSWGTALSIVAANAGHQVTLWSRNADVIQSITLNRRNQAYLPDVRIPDRVRAVGQLQAALDRADLVILATPSHVTRSVLMGMVSALREDMIFVSATKGIEVDSGKRMSEVLAEVLREHFEPKFVCLSGPSFAKEVASGHPTAIVAASKNDQAASLVQSSLSYENLRIYTNEDVVGTELGGSSKNVMAIAAGMVAGLGFGSNSVAALITRGLAEMTRLAVAVGARVETLMGLAGLGDLVLTCTGQLSRNRFVGQELGKGRSLNDIIAGMSEVAEGVRTTEAVRMLAQKLNVEMPIAERVHRVLYERESPREAALALMTRPLRGEFERMI